MALRSLTLSSLNVFYGPTKARRKLVGWIDWRPTFFARLVFCLPLSSRRDSGWYANLSTDCKFGANEWGSDNLFYLIGMYPLGLVGVQHKPHRPAPPSLKTAYSQTRPTARPTDRFEWQAVTAGDKIDVVSQLPIFPPFSDLGACVSFFLFLIIISDTWRRRKSPNYIGLYDNARLKNPPLTTSHLLVRGLEI